MIDKNEFKVKNTSKILNDIIDENDNNDNRLKMADAILRIMDEDGQPLYSMDWIEENILKNHDV